MSTTDAVTFWNEVYAARPAATDPRPNDLLAETVTGLPSGDVLDLGCGDGGDALWLARRGWQVTAVDISSVAVERLTRLARSAGLGGLALVPDPAAGRRGHRSGPRDVVGRAS
ncbi:class I SAM-dependent methyltransferase [Nocardia sp. NPDC051321]|uniref:class I SAM-dependent methyltransferase n=1 Tax=Nocardia sp. NPDC051321 TaxID=3364323 RepID=UPI0037BB17ED